MADDTIRIAIEAVDNASKVISSTGDSMDKLGKQSEEANKDLMNVNQTLAQMIQQDRAAKVLNDTREAMSLLTEAEKDQILQAHQLAEAQKAHIEAAAKVEAAEKTVTDSLEKSSSASKKYSAEFSTLKTQYESGNISQKEYTAGLDNLNKKIQESENAQSRFATGLSKVQAAIVTVNQGMQLVGQVTSKVKEIYDETVGSTIAYAKEVRDLSTNLGISAEETSKLIQAADDYGISVGTITSALQMAVKRGFTPNIETLAKLADEYNSIQDPVERAARLTDVFGRGWTSLTPLLKAGGQAIREAADEAKKLGLTLSEDDVQGARALEVSVDNLNDKVEALKLKVGKDLIPVAINVVDVFGKFGDIVSGTEDPLVRMNRELQYMIGLFGADSEQAKNAQRYIDEYTNALNRGNGIIDASDRAQQRAAESAAQLARAQADATAGAGPFAEAYDESARALKRTEEAAAHVTDIIATLKVGMAGAIKNELTQFTSKQTDLKTKAAELRAEIEKLEASQGRAVTTASKSNLTDNERIATQAKLAAVTEDLTAQQRKANETDAEFASRMANLQVQADGLNEKLGAATTATTTYIDNSKRIKELEGQFDGVNAEIDANAKAHEDATKRILFGYAEQQLAVDGFTETEAKALDALAVKWGLKSQADIDAMQAIRDASAALAADGSIDKYVESLSGDLDKAEGKLQTTKGALLDVAATHGAFGNVTPIEVPVEVSTDAITAGEVSESVQAKLRGMKPVEIPIKPVVSEEALKGAAGDSMAERRKQLESGASNTAKSVQDSTTKAINAVTDVASKATDKVKGVATYTDGQLSALARNTTSKMTAAAGSVIDAFLQMGNISGGELSAVNDLVDKLPTFKEFIYKITVKGAEDIPDVTGASTGATPPGLPGGYAMGGAFTVPAGYPNDSYPIRVSSGERVTVQTPQQQAQPRQGDTYNYVTNVYNPLAAAMLADKQRRERLARSNARMGVS